MKLHITPSKADKVCAIVFITFFVLIIGVLHIREKRWAKKYETTCVSVLDVESAKRRTLPTRPIY